MSATRFLVPVVLVAGLAAPAAAQVDYARVTLHNKSDTAIVFSMKWDTKDKEEEVVLEPGKKLTTQANFRPGTRKPVLTVKYRKVRFAARVAVDLESGHVDPATNNPGRVYDFDKKVTNEGTVFLLTPR